MSGDGKGTKWHRNIADNFNLLRRAHERYRRQTDGRRHIANVAKTRDKENRSKKSLFIYIDTILNYTVETTVRVVLVKKDRP